MPAIGLDGVTPELNLTVCHCEDVRLGTTKSGNGRIRQLTDNLMDQATGHVGRSPRRPATAGLLAMTECI
jgi:hypothetical protein